MQICGVVLVATVCVNKYNYDVSRRERESTINYKLNTEKSMLSKVKVNKEENKNNELRASCPSIFKAKRSTYLN